MMNSGRVAAIVLNGVQLNVLVQADYVICADGGYNLYKGTPNCIIGDLDSINRVPEGVEIIKYATHKNYTDGELAVRKAIAEGYKTIRIYAGLGGRIDHVLGNITLLQVALQLGANATIVDEDCTINYYEAGINKLAAKKGTTISLLPINGAATVASSSGLEYPLNELTLAPPTTMGQSNIATQDEPTITISSGAVLAILTK